MRFTDDMPLRILQDELPREFHSQFQNTQAYTLRGARILAMHYSHEEPWPGREKNVHWWCELQGGLAVGWNENPARGWSFPVIKHSSS